MFSGTNNILRGISSFVFNDGTFHTILSVPQNIVMNLNDIMMVIRTYNTLLKQT